MFENVKKIGVAFKNFMTQPCGYPLWYNTLLSFFAGWGLVDFIYAVKGGIYRALNK